MKKIKVLLVIIFLANIIAAQDLHLPYLKINSSISKEFNKSFRIAIGDIVTNIASHKSGLLDKEAPCILAGLDYEKPWTRDASINVWNGAGLIFPYAAKNTLLAQLGYEEKNVVIIGQYWDSVIWSIGAWQYYLFTGDEEFLSLAYEATKNTILKKEVEEYDSEIGLFRGPAVYGDGVAAYPKVYSASTISGKSGTFSGIEAWPENNPELKIETGYGIPMFALSTNCVYFRAYQLLDEMSIVLNINNTSWKEKSAKLKHNINDKFWNSEKGLYNYLIDPFSGSDAQESLGNSFAILFGIADDQKSESIFDNMYVFKNGVPCVFPAFERYSSEGNAGRHSGTIWPHIQGFWAQACIKHNRVGKFLNEYFNLTDKSFRDKQFVEIYHPENGLQYGGLQEPTLMQKIVWDSTNRQTWSATAYLSMVLYGLAGLEFCKDGIRMNPDIPFEVENFKLENIHYRNLILNINISGSGNKIALCKINQKEVEDNFIQADLTGVQNVEIVLEK